MEGWRRQPSAERALPISIEPMSNFPNPRNGGFGRQGHDPAHIGVVPGGSGTVNAFSTNEISV
jgi:hypothetical protein